jgi:predicted nucleic acid-binding Zn ribbon protein
MKCPVCGQENPDDSKFCNRCGEDLRPNVKNSNGHPWLMTLFILAGLVSGITMIAAGATMGSILSQAGDTIYEAFYHAMGTGFIGLGIFATFLLIGIGIFLGRKSKD